MIWVKALFCEDNNCDKLCVRRVLGSIGFLSFIVACFHPDIPNDSVSTLGIISASLLGITTVDKFTGGKR